MISVFSLQTFIHFIMSDQILGILTGSMIFLEYVLGMLYRTRWEWSMYSIAIMCIIITLTSRFMLDRFHLSIKYSGKSPDLFAGELCINMLDTFPWKFNPLGESHYLSAWGVTLWWLRNNHDPLQAKKNNDPPYHAKTTVEKMLKRQINLTLYWKL